ncbi:CBS domain-containing protein [bacterium]|nr:CBS domain-containing protein [bacterium]NBW98533.1 CBS domain-containing protein [bacterium]NBX83247.1 CBS domain-containing protein [bacterium]
MGGFMKPLIVADLMTEKVVFGRESDSLDSLYDAMAEHSIRHIPIVDSEKNVVGIISQRDLVSAVLFSKESLPASQVKDYLRHTKAAEVMSRGVETIGPDDSVREAGLLMLENKFGCLPVVEGEHLIGVLTESDFIKHVIGVDQESGQRLRRQL